MPDAQPAPTAEDKWSEFVIEIEELLQGTPSDQLLECYEQDGRKPVCPPKPDAFQVALYRHLKTIHEPLEKVKLKERVGLELEARQQEIDVVLDLLRRSHTFRQFCLTCIHVMGTMAEHSFMAAARRAYWDAHRERQELEDYHWGPPWQIPDSKKHKLDWQWTRDPRYAPKKPKDPRQDLPVPEFDPRSKVRFIAADSDIPPPSSTALEELRKLKGSRKGKPDEHRKQ